MPELEMNFKSTSERFGWRLLGNGVGFGRDIIFNAGDALAKVGNLIIRFGDVLGASGKEMYKLSLKIREREDHSNAAGALNEEQVTRGEKIAKWLAVPFIGYTRKNGWTIPGLLTLALRSAEYAIKLPGALVWGTGEAIRTLARLCGYGRDKLTNKAPITDDEKYLRQAEHEYIENVDAAFHVNGGVPALPQYDRQANDNRMYRRIYTLIFLSFVKQIGLALTLPGRLVNWVGRIFSKANLIINNALMMVSRFGETTFLDYAKKLHDARGSMKNGFQEAGAIFLIAVAGAIGVVLTYLPKIFSFITNIYTGIPGFVLENVGRIAAIPGKMLYGFAQRFSPDPNQKILALDKDWNSNDHEDSIDPTQVTAVRAKLYKTFVRECASQKSAYTNGLTELRARHALLVAKAGQGKAEKAAELATEGANGVLATELVGYYTGFGEGYGQFPKANSTLFDDLRTVCNDQRMQFRKPNTATSSLFSYWTKPHGDGMVRSDIAAFVERKVRSLDAADSLALDLPADAAGARNEGFNEKASLLDRTSSVFSAS